MDLSFKALRKPIAVGALSAAENKILYNINIGLSFLGDVDG